VTERSSCPITMSVFTREVFFSSPRSSPGANFLRTFSDARIQLSREEIGPRFSADSFPPQQRPPLDDHITFLLERPPHQFKTRSYSPPLISQNPLFLERCSRLLSGLTVNAVGLRLHITPPTGLTKLIGVIFRSTSDFIPIASCPFPHSALRDRESL